ncbi:ATP-binding cassette sub-family G member 8-like [Tropilaelaps mercedesae]|uniref:ATP-binding cassette sub-family G member 8-like n=1 Tax=Tropilaelaps mercedesae TaxID=418985 RepID=A0A1V9X5J6_9ACAR|nr:ATP-binding cassette sub-family G member 8-like [Tropilaelaps mercedesae]
MWEDGEGGGANGPSNNANHNNGNNSSSHPSNRYRQYSVPPATATPELRHFRHNPATEDLHAWSIYRQNLNSDFTDSALGTTEKSQRPFGNFQLRESTVQTILNHPKYGPRDRNSELAANIQTYLRFGLPRVHTSSSPSNGVAGGANGRYTATANLIKDTSSGYDSSEDGRNRKPTTADIHPSSTAHHMSTEQLARDQLCQESRGRYQPNHHNTSNANYVSHHYGIYNRQPSNQQYMILQQQSQQPNHHHKDYTHLGGFGYGQRTPHRSGSEADLIQEDAQSHRSSRWDTFQQPPKINGINAVQNIPEGRRSAMSHISASSRHINKLPFNRDSFYNSLPGGPDDEIGSLKHPHLQVRGLTFEVDRSSWGQKLCGRARTKLLLLEGLSFEVRGGEILAVVATSENEGTTLLDILSNRVQKYWGDKVRGEFLYNGIPMETEKLQNFIGYVGKDFELCPDMSVRQWMLFTSLVQEPGGPIRDTKERINALLEDLGLGQLRHTRIADLTESEKRRLNVATQLLLDTDIVLLDQPIQGMDILDSFFLIDYLRQWASRGRIVIITIHPPTYEIFTMMSRIAIISTGRMVYFGRRRELLDYFAYIDFPCPPYKNPSDYYLDLVTLDNLSAEAMLESSQRVENLVELYRRRNDDHPSLSDPGPPGITPHEVRRAGFFGQSLALWIRAMIYTFPYNVVHFFRDLMLAALMSVLVGFIFWNVRAGREQEHVSDRYGFYHSLLALCLWPMLLNMITDVWREKAFVCKDVHEKLYSGFAYVVAKLTYSIPMSLSVMCAYVFPAYSMAGIPSQEHISNFLPFLGFMLLYLSLLRSAAMCFSLASGRRHVAAFLTATLSSVFIFSGGWVVHLSELSYFTQWLRHVSPLKWVMQEMIYHEFSSRRQLYECPRNPVVLQENGIQVKADCAWSGDRHAVGLYYNEASSLMHSFLIPLGFQLLFVLASILIVSCTRFNRDANRTPRK